jgi:hypothetical protein
MIRIIVQTDDASMAANVGGNVLTTMRTFDVELPELEEFLRGADKKYMHRQAIGIELIGFASITEAKRG